MNKFDRVFFQKYVSTWIIIKSIIHKHMLIILTKIILNYFWIIILSFLYYYSDLVKIYIPFFILEFFLVIMFIKIIYDVFDWYNDVWIITGDWVVELDWKLFSVDTIWVKYSSIEWLELEQNWIIDTILWKWNLVIHKIWWENFILHDASGAYSAIDEIDKRSKEIKNENDINEFEPQNFNTVLMALSWVVEEYLWKTWYKKDNSEESQELIKKVKKIDWTIDIR